MDGRWTGPGFALAGLWSGFPGDRMVRVHGGVLIVFVPYLGALR